MQLQLASDADFFSQTLGSSHPKPRKVLWDQSLSSSASYLNIRDLLNIYDREFASPTLGSGNHARAGVLTQIPEIPKQANSSSA